MPTEKPAAIDLPPKKAITQPVMGSGGGGGGSTMTLTAVGGGGGGGGGRPTPAAIEMSPRDAQRAHERKLKAEQESAHMLELQTVQGVIGHLNSKTGEYHPVTPRGGPPAPAIGEHPRLKELLGAANDADPLAASDIRFRNRLDHCLGSKPSELVSWGEQNMIVVRSAADTQAQIAKRLGTLNAAELADKCRAASTKPPGLFSRIQGQTAVFYEQTLNAVRPQLTAITSEIETAETGLRQKLEALRLDILALQMTIKTLTDQGAQSVAAGRLRNMVAAQQMAAMGLQGLGNMKTANNKLIEDIDTLLSVVIPGWRLAGG